MHCFTFGKYCGWPLDEVPASYLGLALETFTIPEALQNAIRVEMMTRFELIDQPPPIVPKHSHSQALTFDVVKLIYRRLSMKHHPDKPGGSTQAMQAVNEFYESINQSFQ